MSFKSSKGTQALGKSKEQPRVRLPSPPCPWVCSLVPTNVPRPGPAQTVIHPRKDVFVLKVAKVGPNGDRRSKMELELVTPKGPEKKSLCRIDTRETQCEPDPPCSCCVRQKKKK
ncbi:hypothetical protein evm_012864 [Chilo suppressalis]|nr:hypothetical protein evm_012864 [Chilo suppressalis]